jgi:hypothetical protein
MGKYGMRQVPPPQRPWTIHPIWRGIGCLMFLIGPFIAFAAANMIVTMGAELGWFPIPPELAQPYNEIAGLYKLPTLEYPINHFFASLVATGILLLIGFAVIMIVYAMVYSLLGPRRNPLDAPPVRDRPVKKRR